MAAGTTNFPAFLQLNYEENGVNARFERDIRSMTQSAEQKFKASFEEVSRTIDRALSVKRNQAGSLDLGVEELKAAAAASEARAIAAREVATATAMAAKAEGDYSRSARLATAATSALAREEEEAARAARSQAAAAEQVQIQLNKTKSATDALVLANRQGTTASGAVTNSLGSQRFAMVQVGQQLQDMQVGFVSGQRASTVFAQQLPQLGFALSGFNGKIGALGRFLAGPWGVAVFAATTALSLFVAKMFESDESAKEAENSLSVLEQTKTNLERSVREVTAALKEENDELERNGQSAYSAAQRQIELANSKLRVAAATRQQISADADFFLNQLKSPFRDVDLDEGTIRRIESLKKQAAEQAGLIEQLESTIRQNTIVTAQEEVAAANDAATASTLKYQNALDSLNKSYGRNDISQDQYVAGLNRITKKRDAEIEAIRAAKKTGSNSERDTRTRQQVLADFTRELEQRGIDVISSYRSAAKQNSLYKQGLTPADGYKIPSRHQSYRAVDADKRTFNEQAAYEAAQAAGLRGFRVLTESGGRKHLDFTGSGKPGTVDEKLGQRREKEAKAAARETSRLASLSDQAAESIARINEQYDEQPRLIDRAAQSTRKLDNIISELSDPKNAGTPRLKELIAEAQQARALAANAVNTEISQYAEDNEANLRILELQAAGLFEQADILTEINRLDERLGLSVALETLTDQKIVAQGILEDEQSTNEERAAALVVIQQISEKMAEISGQQTRIRNEAEYRITQEERLNEIISRRREETGYYLEALNSVRGTLTSILSGQKTDILGDLKKTFADLRGSLLFDNLFGDAFAQIEAQLNKNTPLGQANARLVQEVDGTARSANSVSESLDYVAEAANAAAAKLQGIANPEAVVTPASANDNEIVISAIRDEVAIENRSVSQLADAMAAGIVGPLSGSLNEIFGTKFSQQLSGALSSALSGYLQGGEVGGVLGGLQGVTKILGDEGVMGKGIAESISKVLGTAGAGAQTGTQVAGIAKALGLGSSFSTTGSQIGGAIGSALPIPGGEIIGSVIGGFLGGLFKKKPKGSAVITGVDNPASIYGNKSSVRENLTELSGGIQASIAAIAEQFDAEVGAFAVSVGAYKDNFRVSASGSTAVKNKRFSGPDALYNGKDAEEAARIALLNAIQDGAIKGIRAGSQRLLAAGKDLEKAVRDALSFENVFKRLRAYKDPVGAALDALDKEFNKLVEIFGRAGASAQEYAELEELYGIERAQAVKEASEKITGSLRDLFRDLTIGDSGLSLRTRLGNAQGEYDPLAARVAAGDITAYDDYADAARNLLDLQREVYGSSEDYFRLLDEVTQLTKTRIDEESNIASLAIDRDTPFTVDQTPVVNVINSQTAELVSWLAAIAKNSGGAAYSGSVSGGGGGRTEPINRDVVNF